MLGIVGGMGPLASAFFYEMLIQKTPAEKDQEHIDLILLGHSTMPDRTATILHGSETDRQRVQSLLEKDVEKLVAVGCDEVVITCNTAHYFVARMPDTLREKVINLIDVTAEKIARSGKKRIAILATDGTIRTGLYQKALEKAGIDSEISDPDLQKIVMRIIYDHVKSGKKVPGQLWHETMSRVRASGCDGAVLGCTELSVAFDEFKGDKTFDRDGLSFFDPLEIAAERCIALEKNVKTSAL